MITGSDGTAAGYVYAFERRSGAVRWKTAVGGFETDLLRSGGNALGGTSDGALVALDLATGKVVWRFATEVDRRRPFRARTPALLDGRVFFAGGDGAVYALDAPAGKLLWKRDLGCAFTTSVLLAGGHLFVGGADHRIYRLAPASGEVTAQYTAEDFPHSVLTVQDGVLLALAGERTALGLDLDLRPRWSRTVDAPWSTPRPLVAGDVAVVGTEGGELLALRLADGTTAWSAHIDGVPRGLARAGGTLLAGTLAGAVLAYERPDLATRAPR